MAIGKYVVVAALAAAVHASPAPQAPNFASVTAAASVANGPLDNGDSVQTASLATTFAAPPASTAAAAPTTSGLSKRTVSSKCTCPWYDPFCLWNAPQCPPAPATTSAKSSSTPASKTTSTTGKSTSAAATFPATTPSAAAATTPLPSCPATLGAAYYAALTTGYTTDPALSGTKTATAAGSCPTQPEAGTDCGFINPLDPCAPQPDGYGPVPKPDTPAAFLADPELHALAQNAPATVPSIQDTQYQQVFKDLNAAVSAQSYVALFTLDSYNVAKCAAFCDCSELCTSFNIFAERDPTVNPSTNQSTAPTVWGRDCPNPPSMTSFKCTLWGSSIDSDDATNQGQYREEFDVVITASDGYDRTSVSTPPAPQPNPPQPPKNCHGKGIDAPKYCMGNHFFPGPYNPHACYDYAVSLNSANSKAGLSQSCSFFNAYYLHKNGKPHGTYCNLYNSVLDESWATYAGGNWGGDDYECTQSWGFSL